MRWLRDLEALPAGTLGRRAGLAFALALGVTLTAMGSMFWSLVGPIPFRFLPDVRPVLTFGSGLLLGLYAAGGGAHRRKLALWGVVGYVVAFHLEEASVHWIAPFPGSITGTRVGIVGTLGSLLALASVLLLHIEVEHQRLARDLVARGAEEAGARKAATSLRAAGAARVLALAGAAAGVGALVRVGEVVLGNDAPGGVYALLLGAALLLACALLLVRTLPRAREESRSGES